MEYRLVVFGVKNTTEDFIRYIHNHIMNIDLIVTVGQDVIKSNHISGYSDLSGIAKELNIATFLVNDYSLKNEEINSFFKYNNFHIGISIGWQRIIPIEILNSFKFGVFGFHGSTGYLPYGRGRSPLNWSIIKGHKRFVNHCFRYNNEPDAGQIYNIKIFEINSFDTIETLQHKVTLVGRQQIKELLNDYTKGDIKLNSQVKGRETWYPKRNPEDGKISLEMSTKETYNLIRGVSYPFPGAFLYLKGEKIIIWEAHPFDYFIDFKEYRVGEVIEIFNSDFILRTIDGSLIVKKYEYAGGNVEKGNVLY